MLSWLPISLAQLKAGNNYEKLKNEIRQLLYSLYRSKRFIYRSLVNIIQTWKKSLRTLKIVREMSLTNLFIRLLTNLILKPHSTKILDWLTQVCTTPGQTLNLHTTTISEIMNLICLIILIQFLTFKVTLNLSSKNTKIWLKILRYKFTPIK